MTPLARWLADPSGGIFHPLWFVAGGAITLLASGVLFRVPQQYWRYSGVVDLRNIIAAAVVSATLFSCLLWVTGYGLPTPAFPFIDALMLIMGLGGIRLGARLVKIRQKKSAQQIQGEKVLLVGTEEHLDFLIRLIQKGILRRRILGLVVTEGLSRGQRIHGYSILGVTDSIRALIARMIEEGNRPSQVILADPELRGADLMALLSAIGDYDIPVLRMPFLDHFHPAEHIELQPVVLEDLLNRAPIRVPDSMRTHITQLIEGKVVLVTGAGGSIGTELVQQIAHHRPAHLVLLERSEYALWKIGLTLSEQFSDIQYDSVIGDVQNREKMAELFARYRPELVFHAAALKHVPLVEQNPCEAILTNVVGTRIIADCAHTYKAHALVVISTDKAVHPSSVMGVTKRCAEIYTQALDYVMHEQGSRTSCLTVRFGNVLGSTGSVVPLFQHQLANGGPLTVTDPEMTRYFMTISEAVGLVLQAMQRRLTVSTAGSLFVLDMGKPVRIMELARQMIRLAGLQPDRDMAIAITGRREGEKLEETLFYEQEYSQRIDRNGLWEVVPSMSLRLSEVAEYFEQLEAACHGGDTEKAFDILHEIVPEFLPVKMEEKHVYHSEYVS
ncbi:polysaccharide biosynthesis protein [Saccharibacter sp. 17.LH.SD]|nr:nucleoside-diphosphate sugar epimerase/dehydratase [Saccharibacter sp. 17.LH.SD]MXV44179.1 polysaccharide biosynthesis protein [Saccharibacter sp. 17.LH.SD]